ncbi:CBS domain-containing protein [Acidovorax sp. MR-S7]|jgi:CBS domain-containing protein|uniref:CBS domain-containing protein n=1 Tax=unclassified Acidovorax TaxID=2684926 RepID=UPI0003752852|nr:CBS domain-containing protein [Acidovorax sp. MR-S7]GAD22226.1 FOG: CBS domain [Acidovorax sp. MR-S7]
MTTVAEILKSKSSAQIYSVAPSDTILSALRLMADKGIGALLVMEDGQIAGIFTERDYARKVVLLGRSSGDTPVREVMTRAVRFVRSTQSTDHCMALMTENRLRHLPVVDDGEVVGLVSIGDLVKNIISHQQFLIEQMEQYITGAR